MATISAFRVTQHSQIFSLFFRNQIQCIALYQLYNSQALLNLCRGYYKTLLNCQDWAQIKDYSKLVKTSKAILPTWHSLPSASKRQGQGSHDFD